jgi:hypothetical protein
MNPTYKEISIKNKKKCIEERRKFYYYYHSKEKQNLSNKGLKDRILSATNSGKTHHPPVKIIPYNKIVIYTTLFGNYDILKNQPNFNKVQYICFSDRTIRNCHNWKISVNPEICPNLSPVMRAKYFKLHPFEYFPDADYSIYIDASIQIANIDFIQSLLSYVTDNGMAAYIHPKRKCIFEEKRRLLSLNEYKQLPIEEQLKSYQTEGMPLNYGLWAGGILIRKNNDNAKMICSLWWNEIIKWSYRDQISLPYVLWKNKLKIDTITLRQYANNLFKIHPHIYRKK